MDEMMEGDQLPMDNKPQVPPSQMDDDMQPLMDPSPSQMMDPLPQDSIQERSTKNDPKYLYCFSMKCAVTFFGIYITLDLILNCAHAYFINENDYLSEPFEIYYFIYIILLLPLFVAFTLFLIYYCEKDSTYERSKLPLAVLLAFSSSLLIFTWMVVYILAIYPYDDVFIGMGEKAEEPSKEEGYVKITRGEYLIAFGTWPAISAVFYLFSWLDTRDFIERNHGYQNSR